MYVKILFVDFSKINGGPLIRTKLVDRFNSDSNFVQLLQIKSLLVSAPVVGINIKDRLLTKLSTIEDMLATSTPHCRPANSEIGLLLKT